MCSGHQSRKRRHSVYSSVCIALDQQSNIESIINRMDQIYGTDFNGFLRDEKNVPCIAKKLSKIIEHEEVKKVIDVMEWIISNWTPKIQLKFVDLVTTNLSPAKRMSILFGLVGKHMNFFYSKRMKDANLTEEFLLQ